MNRELNRVLIEIGGAPRVEKILLDFYNTMSKDVMIGFFFEGFDLTRISKMQAAFLLRSAGLIPTYEGRTPDRAHEKIPPILPGHFDRRIQILKSTLKEAGLNEAQTTVWTDFEEAFRPMVVSS